MSEKLELPAAKPIPSSQTAQSYHLYKSAVDRAERREAIDNPDSFWGGVRRFVLVQTSPDYASIHNAAMDAPHRALKNAQQDLLERMPEIQQEAFVDATEAGKVIKVPDSGVFEAATNVRVIEPDPRQQ